MNDKIFKNLDLKTSLFETFVTPRNFFLKSTKIFFKSAKIFLFLFYNVYKEKMLTIENEDKRA